MTHVALIGGTGKTGRRVLTRLLDQGHTVRMLARDPAAVTVNHPGLDVVPGDVLDTGAVDTTVAGATVVLSLFGQVKGSPRTLQTDGTGAIVAAMKHHGVPRIVSLSGGGLPAPQDRPQVPDRLIRGLMRVFARHVLADAEGHLEVLQESGLEWTVVRGPRLSEAPGKNRYRVGWVGVDASTSISRDDLADFIVTLVEDRSYAGRMPFVSH